MHAMGLFLTFDCCHLPVRLVLFLHEGFQNASFPLQEELQGAHEVNETQHAVNGNLERETSSTDVNATGNTTSDKGQQPMSEDAKKRRRQEINRESARRVRKRKTEAHVQLQEEVRMLQRW